MYENPGGKGARPLLPPAADAHVKIMLFWSFAVATCTFFFIFTRSFSNFFVLIKYFNWKLLKVAYSFSRSPFFEKMNTLLSAIFKFCTTKNLFKYFNWRSFSHPCTFKNSQVVSPPFATTLFKLPVRLLLLAQESICCNWLAIFPESCFPDCFWYINFSHPVS